VQSENVYLKAVFGTVKPELSKDELETYTQRFISSPSVDPKKPSPQNIGGSIDLLSINNLLKHL
jgi:hypothetical protein